MLILGVSLLGEFLLGLLRREPRWVSPGFVGIGKLYISSAKFISAEGGIERLVWMPKALKEEVEPRVRERLEKIGRADLFDKIATEEHAETPDQLVEFLTSVEHPALAMPALM